jgi:hypothetical protein
MPRGGKPPMLLNICCMRSSMSWGCGLKGCAVFALRGERLPEVAVTVKV